MINKGPVLRRNGIDFFPEVYLPTNQAVCGFQAYAFVSEMVDELNKANDKLAAIRGVVKDFSEAQNDHDQFGPMLDNYVNHVQRLHEVIGE